MLTSALTLSPVGLALQFLELSRRRLANESEAIPLLHVPPRRGCQYLDGRGPGNCLEALFAQRLVVLEAHRQCLVCSFQGTKDSAYLLDLPALGPDQCCPSAPRPIDLAGRRAPPPSQA